MVLIGQSWYLAKPYVQRKGSTGSPSEKIDQETSLFIKDNQPEKTPLGHLFTTVLLRMNTELFRISCIK